MTTAPSADSESGRVRLLLAGSPPDLLAVIALAALVFAVPPWVRRRLLVAAVARRHGVRPRVARLRARLGAVPRTTNRNALAPGESASAYSPGTIERFWTILRLQPRPAADPRGRPRPAWDPLRDGHRRRQRHRPGGRALVVGILRRAALSPSDRYSPPRSLGYGARTWTGWQPARRPTPSSAPSRRHRPAGRRGSLAFGLTGPTQGESYTSVSLVTETSDGDYVASGYPDELHHRRGPQPHARSREPLRGARRLHRRRRTPASRPETVPAAWR